MFRLVTATMAAGALAGFVSLSAQEPRPTPKPEAEPPAQQQPPATTLTGCVQEARTTDGGTAYILNNVQGGAAAMYILSGPPPSELAPHVNHKVEVTGQASAPPPPAEPDASGKRPLRPPSIQVENVKMVAESCK